MLILNLTSVFYSRNFSIPSWDRFEAYFGDSATLWLVFEDVSSVRQWDDFRRKRDSSSDVSSGKNSVWDHLHSTRKPENTDMLQWNKLKILESSWLMIP